MSLRCGSGQGTGNTRDAVDGALRQSLAGLGGSRPAIVFAFAGPDHDLKGVQAQVLSTCPDAQVLGATTAGEFTERGLSHGGVAVMALASDELSTVSASAVGLREGQARLTSELMAPYATARKAALSREQREATTILLTDGLAGTGEQLVEGLAERLPANCRMVGGAAGDEGRFKATSVGLGATAGTDGAVALHVFGKHPWGVGVKHGLRTASRKMRVTRATGNVVHEIDGKPAFESYRAHAAERGVVLTPKDASNYLIANELGVLFFDEIRRARAPLFAGPDGSLTCAASIPQGSTVSILDGDPDNMLAAARSAAQEARAGLGGRGAAGVLVFDCVCRGMILSKAFQSEIDAVRSVFDGAPITGFLTYGEIARYEGQLNGWHNTTAVVLAIPS